MAVYSPLQGRVYAQTDSVCYINIWLEGRNLLFQAESLTVYGLNAAKC